MNFIRTFYQGNISTEFIPDPPLIGTTNSGIPVFASSSHAYNATVGEQSTITLDEATDADSYALDGEPAWVTATAIDRVYNLNPTTAGLYSFRWVATNTDGTASQNIYVVVASGTPPPPVTMLSPT